MIVGADLVESEDPISEARLSLLLFKKLLVSKLVGLTPVKSSLLKVRSLKKGVSIRSMGENIFSFQFYHEADKRKVMEGRPWHV